MNTSVSGVQVMDQYADRDTLSAENLVQSPLAHIAESRNEPVAGLGTESTAPTYGRSASASDGNGSTVSTVRLEECSVSGMLILRAGDAAGKLSQALQKQLEVALPERLGSQVAGDSICIRWMSPDEWLLSCPLQQAFDIESRLRKAVKGHIAIVNASGGYSLLTLSGRDALNVLRKSTGYDVNPHNFADGKVVNTVMAKAQVTLRAVTAESYEIIVRRSFADYLWLWLERAAREYK